MLRERLHEILYVDDEADIREIVESTLQLMPQFSIRTAGSGEEALRMMRASAPDIVLLDVTMPGMDGPSTLARMREDATLGKLPVIFVTGHTSSWEVAGFLALGAVHVLAKPFEPMRLSEEILEAWERLDARTAN